MTPEAARTIVQQCVDGVAPGAGAETIASDADLREVLDLDSMDVFNLVAAIADETGIDIPDRDVAALRTIDAFAERLLTARPAA